MKIQWTTKKICKAVYGGVFVLLFALALLLFRQKGLFINVEYQEKFYRQTAAQESGRTFQRGDILFAQEYFYPQSNTVYIRVSGDDIKAKSWKLTFGEENAVSIDDGEEIHKGHWQGKGTDIAFLYDDEKPSTDWFVETTGGEKSINSDQFLLSDLLRMAQGQTDQRNRYSLEAFLGWILLQILAYPLLFHQDRLFELRKAFEWDYKNADALEPSGFYYFGNYVAAALCWGTSLMIYLVALAIV